MTKATVTRLTSPSTALAKSLSDYVTGEPLFIGVVCKGNGYHHVGISDCDDWSMTVGLNEKVVGVYSVPHLTEQEAMFCVLQVGQAAKRATKLGVDKKKVNRWIDQACQKLELSSFAA